MAEIPDEGADEGDARTASALGDLRDILGHALTQARRDAEAAQAHLAAAGDFEVAGNPAREVGSAVLGAQALLRAGARAPAVSVAEVALATATGLDPEDALACQSARADALDIVADAREEAGDDVAAAMMRVTADQIRTESA